MCIHLSSKVDIFMNLGMEDAGPLCTVNKLPKLVVCLGQTTNTISQKYNLKLINQQGILIVLMTWQNGCRLLAFGTFRSQSPFFVWVTFSLFFYSFSFQSKYGWNRKSEKPPSPIYNTKQYTTLFWCLSMSISNLFLIVRHDCWYSP